MDLISIIDLGTGSIRNTVYDLSGNIINTVKRDNPLIHPQPGWVEQDPVYWWKAIKETFLDFDPALRSAIIGISATSQREGIVPVNRHFEPLGNIIIWLDGRTTEIGQEIIAAMGEETLYEITGLVANPAWSLSKILWIKKYKSDIYDKAYKFLQAEDYVISRLCGKAVSEYSIASRTSLLDVFNRKWSEKILNTFDIAIEKLPVLHEPGNFIGEISTTVAFEFGLNTNVKIFIGAGDQQAAAIGVGAVEEGMVSIGIGTSSALSMTLNKPVKTLDHKIILNCAALPGKWEYEPPIWNTGGLIKWFFDNIQCSDLDYNETLEKACQIPAGCEGLIALPYFSGAGSPRWNPIIKGCFYGLGLHHNRYHILRALLECIAFEIKFNTDSMQASGIQLKQVILSGGASINRPLCQIICDVLQTDVKVFNEAEASSRGVFHLVKNSLGGNYNNTNDVKSYKPEYISITTDGSRKDFYNEIFKKYIKLGDKLEELSF